MTTVWTAADQTEAMTMGWLIADIDSSGKLEIQRYDDAPQSLRFGSDAEAREWVALAAALGNDLEQRALAVVKAPSDPELCAKLQRKIMIKPLRMGDQVKVLATEHAAAKPYVGQTGKLDYIEYGGTGKSRHAIAYHVEFAEDMIVASRVEPNR